MVGQVEIALNDGISGRNLGKSNKNEKDLKEIYRKSESEAKLASEGHQWHNTEKVGVEVESLR